MTPNTRQKRKTPAAINSSASTTTTLMTVSRDCTLSLQTGNGVWWVVMVAGYADAMIRVSLVQCDLSASGFLQRRNGDPQLYDCSPGNDACTGKSEAKTASRMIATPAALTSSSCRLRLASGSTATTLEHSERATPARTRDDRPDLPSTAQRVDLALVAVARRR